MSHTFKSSDGTKFIYNSDLSGSVEIRFEDTIKDGSIISAMCLVDGQALVEFIADYVRNRQIEMLESETDPEKFSSIDISKFKHNR